MQEVKKVVDKDQTNIAGDGSVVRQRARSVSTDTDPKVTLANLVWYIYGVIAIVLAIRFVMKLAGANSGNAFVNFIYSVSGVLSAPFDSIFGVSHTQAGTVNSVFEPSILVAIAVYGLVAMGVVKLLSLNEPTDVV